MVSVKDMVSITFYVTAETKIYEPSEIHLLFGRLFPGSHLSPMKHIGEKVRYIILIISMRSLGSHFAYYFYICSREQADTGAFER